MGHSADLIVIYTERLFPFVWAGGEARIVDMPAGREVRCDSPVALSFTSRRAAWKAARIVTRSRRKSIEELLKTFDDPHEEEHA